MVTFSKIRPLLAIAAAALLAACGTAGNNAARKPVQTAKPAAVVGLALGGGASKGFAHVGIVKVLKENGIPVRWLPAHRQVRLSAAFLHRVCRPTASNWKPKF